MTTLLVGLAVVLALITIGAVAYAISLSRRQALKGTAELEEIRAARRELEAHRKAVELEAQAEALKLRTELEEELSVRRIEVTRQEQRNLQREEQLDRQQQDLLQRSEAVTSEAKSLEAAREEVEALRRGAEVELERVAGLGRDEARQELLAALDRELIAEKAERIRHAIGEAKAEADERAREVLVTSIQRHAADQTGESSVSVVPLPNDEVKGRIIGREGRNIRAFQAATGVDLIIDDTPDAIIISGFDPLRREVARLALEQLLSDGRIHPARIEEIVEKVRKDLDISLKEEAEKLAFELGITDIHPEILKLLGRLKYRTSYGQNNLVHAREVAYLCQMMAHDLGLDPRIAKRAGLLHDIGKSLSHEGEGSHPSLGGEAAKKYGESSQVINAIMSHHGDIEPNCLESVLVAAADAISAARPGARRESIDVYVKRLEKLETIANSFKGVEKSYAIQAGREIRIIVNQDQVSDGDLLEITRGIAQKIENELTYPGQIKVTVIRENRIVEYAR